MAVYSFDIDLTIAYTNGNDYPNSVPKKHVVNLINRLYDEGNRILIFTGRGSHSGKNWHDLTERQLQQWGLKYHKLIMGKPHADFFIDDKNIGLCEVVSEEHKKIVDLLLTAFKHRGKVLICGNGGLAAESEHFAAEFVGKFAFDVYLPCLALTTNSSLTTAISNDMGFENVYSHQVKVLGRPNDVFIGMTTSQSKNIVKACNEAKGMGLKAVILCSINSIDFGADCTLRFEGKDTAVIQNQVITFLHWLAYEVKRKFLEECNGRFSPDKP
jgi:D-sedoheptulose 7-phosphate isomerase